MSYYKKLCLYIYLRLRLNLVKFMLFTISRIPYTNRSILLDLPLKKKYYVIVLEILRIVLYVALLYKGKNTGNMHDHSPRITRWDLQYPIIMDNDSFFKRHTV